jgi:NAD(P)-dependent dehydrogenase (short-subunit alcohol dehydrogenase family)
MNVLVLGASRGIGLELVRQYRAAGDAVTGTARDEAGLASLRALGARAIALEVRDAESCARLAWPLEGERFDLIVYAAGVSGRMTTSLETPSQAEFDIVMHTNVLGAMRLLPACGELLAPGASLVLISSRMGSIGARSNPTGWLYRASKAALNSVLKDAALVLAGRALCVSFHPGWVRTDMGGANADLSVQESVASLRRSFAALKPADHGGFFDHDGTPIPW